MSHYVPFVLSVGIRRFAWHVLEICSRCCLWTSRPCWWLAVVAVVCHFDRRPGDDLEGTQQAPADQRWNQPSNGGESLKAAWRVWLLMIILYYTYDYLMDPEMILKWSWNDLDGFIMFYPEFAETPTHCSGRIRWLNSLQSLHISLQRSGRSELARSSCHAGGEHCRLGLMLNEDLSAADPKAFYIPNSQRSLQCQ